MDIKEQGIKGEKEICNYLRSIGCPVKKSDGHTFIDGKYYFLETKEKEPFEPPPFYGQGLDTEQLEHYIHFYLQTGIRTLFVVLDREGNQVWNYLDELYQGPKTISKTQKITIFPLTQFKSREIIGLEFVESSESWNSANVLHTPEDSI